MFILVRAVAQNCGNNILPKVFVSSGERVPPASHLTRFDAYDGCVPAITLTHRPQGRVLEKTRASVVVCVGGGALRSAVV